MPNPNVLKTDSPREGERMESDNEDERAAGEDE
jgi:hypothetical protein